MPPPKLEYFFLSEDARQDRSGLLTVTGMLPRAVSAPGPVVLPKIVATVILSGMEEVSAVRISSEIRFETDHVVGSAPGEWIEITAKEELTHFQQFMMVPFGEAGDYLFRLRFDFNRDAGITAVYSRRIRLTFEPAPTTTGGGTTQHGA